MDYFLYANARIEFALLGSYFAVQSCELLVQSSMFGAHAAMDCGI